MNLKVAENFNEKQENFIATFKFFLDTNSVGWLYTIWNEKFSYCKKKMHLCPNEWHIMNIVLHFSPILKFVYSLFSFCSYAFSETGFSSMSSRGVVRKMVELGFFFHTSNIRRVILLLLMRDITHCKIFKIKCLYMWHAFRIFRKREKILVKSEREGNSNVNFIGFSITLWIFGSTVNFSCSLHKSRFGSAIFDYALWIMI